MSVDKPSEIRHHLNNDVYDLVTLDLSMDRSNGLSLVSEIRSCFHLPLIATAPSHVGESLRVAALELGADDCIAKPFGLLELAARIRAVLRRRDRLYADSGSRSQSKSRRCLFGGWQLDRRARRLGVPDGSCVPLTKTEYALLTAFLDEPMIELSREHLLRATRLHEDLNDRTIDVQILRLRQKLRPTPEVPEIIRTIRGVGYMFMLAVENIG